MPLTHAACAATVRFALLCCAGPAVVPRSHTNDHLPVRLTACTTSVPCYLNAQLHGGEFSHSYNLFPAWAYRAGGGRGIWHRVVGEKCDLITPAVVSCWVAAYTIGVHKLVLCVVGTGFTWVGSAPAYYAGGDIRMKHALEMATCRNVSQHSCRQQAWLVKKYFRYMS